VTPVDPSDGPVEGVGPTEGVDPAETADPIEAVDPDDGRPDDSRRTDTRGSGVETDGEGGLATDVDAGVAPPTSLSGDLTPGFDADARGELARLERLSYYLDDLFAVPGTGYRIGLDPLLGLLPGVGDVTTSALSAYIVARAAALGVPRATLARMVVVLLVDTLLGSLPLVGDAFDAVWKANARNVRLLEARLDAPDGDGDGAAADRRYVLVATALLTGALVLVALGVTATVWWTLGRAGLL
jgi:hypothetical protein